MFEQIFDTVRKASESSVQLQQEMMKQWTQSWAAVPTQAGGGLPGGIPDLGRGLQRRWAELTLDFLRKQRESVDAAYASGIQIIEQTFRVSEAKSPEDYRRTVEDLWRKLFESFKDRSETQFRDFQKWSEKSAEIVQDARS